MLSNDIAIVGIDSQIADLSDVDQVARALYLGKLYQPCVDKSATYDNDEALSLAIKSAEQMLRVINEYQDVIALADVDIIIVDQNAVNESAVDESAASETLLPAFARFNNVCCFSQLSEALTYANSSINDNKLVAIIGVNSTIDKSANSEEAANTISFDSKFSAYQSISGIASILLAPQTLAASKQLPVYAKLSALAVSKTNKHAMQTAITQSLSIFADTQISLVEVSALADENLSELESEALLQAYSGDALTCAISSARSVTGEGHGLSQVLGLVRAVIALQQRYIPGINDWQSVPNAAQTQWQNASFYFPTQARPCYPNSNGSAQHAAYSCLTKDSYCHLVLTEYKVEEGSLKETASSEKTTNNTVDYRANGFLANSALRLVMVNGNDEAALKQQLLTLQQSIVENNHDLITLKSMADQQYQHYLTTPKQQYTIVLLAESLAELSKEIELALQGINQTFAALAQAENSNKTQWKTPKGSYFTAEPVAESTAKDSNNVCFMYPGIGATYVGLGRDLLHLFPQIFPEVIHLADDIGHSLKDNLLNPRSINRLDFTALKQRDLALRGSLADIAEAGVAFACVFSKIFTKVFNITPSYATGYSMGEVSMYAALGCWQKPSVMSSRLANSVTFNQRLSGELSTLRELWRLTSTDLNSANPIWETYSIKASLAEVEAACVGEPRVYCTIVNSPDNVLLAGYPSDCLRVIDKLGVRAMPMNMANAIHSQPAKAEYDEMVSLYTMPVNKRLSTKLYSSSCYLPVPQLSKAIANSIAKCLCDRVDFPRLVNSLYNQGARVFIEMGAGRSLCTWLDKSLQHQQSLDGIKRLSTSVAINAKGVSDELSYFRAVAKLVSHGVVLDLNNLFYGSMIIKMQSPHSSDELNKR